MNEGDGYMVVVSVFPIHLRLAKDGLRHGCTRLENGDIQDLADEIRDKRQNPGVPVPYQRYNSPVGDFYSPFPNGVALA